MKGVCGGVGGEGGRWMWSRVRESGWMSQGCVCVCEKEKNQ